MPTVSNSFAFAGLLFQFLQLALLVILVVRRKERSQFRREAPTPAPSAMVPAAMAPASRPRTVEPDDFREVVVAAVAERLEHERERPDRYPVDHRVTSVLQRARRRLHFEKTPCPDDALLLGLIHDEIRRQA
jgi:hypothetical protein